MFAKLKSCIELNFKLDEKVKVCPVGDVIGLDGRGSVIDGNVLIGSIAKNNIHIVLDENHSFGEALGWFDKGSFELRDDGVYATLELNPKGAELIKNRSYRYLSPVFDMGDNRTVSGLDSVGLVNRPNITDVELNSIDNIKSENEELKKKIEIEKNSIDNIKAENEELKKKLAYFQKGDLDMNSKVDDSGITKMLGITIEEYNRAKGD